VTRDDTTTLTAPAFDGAWPLSTLPAFSACCGGLFVVDVSGDFR